MATIQIAPRVFKVGPSLLEDPDPSATPEEALALYVPSHPALAHCTLSEPRVEGDRLVYEVVRPTATTKGDTSADASARIEAEIAAWESEQAGRRGELADPEAIKAAHRFLLSIRQSHRGGVRDAGAEKLDALLIPMC